MLHGQGFGRGTRLIAGLMVIGLVVSACSSSSSNAAPDKLQQVISAGTVRVADCLSFAPFGFMDENGKPAGYDVDIATEMAAQLGVKLEMVDTTADNRIPNLQTDKVDVVICNFTENPTRAKQINFTMPYVIAGEVLLVKKDSTINGISRSRRQDRRCRHRFDERRDHRGRQSAMRRPSRIRRPRPPSWQSSPARPTR